MNKDFVYLTYYQIMAFEEEIEKMRKENQYFNDEFVSMFENYTLDIACKKAFIPKIIIPNTDKFKISISLFNYLERLTNINVNDKDFMKEFTKKRIKKDEELWDRIINGNYLNSISNDIHKTKTYKK